MINWLKNKYKNAKAKWVKHYRTEQIVATLKIAHASELASTPGEQWPAVRERQSKEILAVRDGHLDIVDRRSWQWPYLPETLHRLKQPIIKNLPYNVRRFARTPVPRRAINLIKNSIISLEWGIVTVTGTEPSNEQKERIEIAKKVFEHPNNQQSFQEFVETGLDDMCINGAFVIEPRLTPDPDRPLKMWNVDSSTIRIFADWTEGDPDQPHYAQMTGLKGERGIIVFYDDELIYIKDNPSTDSPFGMGKMEIGFQSVNAFVGVQEMAGRAGSDQIHKTWLWWTTPQMPSNTDIIRRHIMNDLEGQSKVSLVAGMAKPEVIDINPVTEADLLLNWQEMLIRMIGNAFDLSPMALGVERDINRSTGEVLDDKDFRSAIVPMATKIQEAFTRHILHKNLGYTDLQFLYLNLDDPDAETKIDINTKLFGVNSTTPNEIRQAMGKQKSSSPFADLTQFEMILINTMAGAMLQQQAAGKAAKQQQQMMQLQAPSYGYNDDGSDDSSGYGDQDQEQDSGQGQDVDSAAQTGPKKPQAPKPKATPSVKPLQMPKLPKLTPPKLPKTGSGVAADSDDDSQDSGQDDSYSFLQTLTDTLSKYEDILQQREADLQDVIELKPTAKDKRQQMQRYQNSLHVPAEIERTVYYRGRTQDLDKTQRQWGRFQSRSKHGFRGKNYNDGFGDQRKGGEGLGKEVDHNPPYPQRRRTKTKKINGE